MIPVWLTPKILKLGAVILILGSAVFLGYKVNGWRNDAVRYKSEWQAAENRLEIHRAALKAAQRAAKDYHDELETIRNRSAPGGPVRLCVDPAVPGADSTAGAGGTAPASGLVSGAIGSDHQAGPDIGADLRALALRADELSAQMRALQALEAAAKENRP